MYFIVYIIRAGVCRPCDTIELTATNCNFSLCRRVKKVCADRQLLDTVDRGRKRAYVAVREHG